MQQSAMIHIDPHDIFLKLQKANLSLNQNSECQYMKIYNLTRIRTLILDESAFQISRKNVALKLTLRNIEMGRRFRRLQDK